MTKGRKYDASRTDRQIFEAQARSGLIPEGAVAPLAAVLAAMRNAQEVLGPGHLAMDACFEAVPKQYARNWLKGRMKAVR